MVPVPALPDDVPERVSRSVAPPVVTVLGGDERERELIIALASSGYRVLTCGRELSNRELTAGVTAGAAGITGIPGVARTISAAGVAASPARTAPARTISAPAAHVAVAVAPVAAPVAAAAPASAPAPEAMAAASAVIAPLAGISGDGRVFSRAPHPGLTLDAAALGALRPGTLLCSGRIGEPLRTALTDTAAVRLIDLADHDELAILNSIPSAEGAIQMAMEQSPFCLHGAASLVLGFGRTAQTLALMLRGIGSHVTVVARSPAARASAQAFCLAAAPLTDLNRLLQPPTLFCFNTVPAPILTAETLAGANADLTIIDLASRPGGTDFAAAAAAGLRATLAPGLPGIVAPRTAGLLLSKVIMGLLEEFCYGTQ